MSDAAEEFWKNVDIEKHISEFIDEHRITNPRVGENEAGDPAILFDMEGEDGDWYRLNNTLTRWSDGTWHVELNDSEETAQRLNEDTGEWEYLHADLLEQDPDMTFLSDSSYEDQWLSPMLCDTGRMIMVFAEVLVREGKFQTRAEAEEAFSNEVTAMFVAKELEDSR